ncbi:MAG: hypothetical protein HQK97_04135 [Nitrospirae bacterium]|nr:hypothetical protein [Nitrospirota bacterium]
MRQKYDITLKDILKDIPKVFLKLITGYETGKFLDVQFPDIALREPDLVFEVVDGKILHFEIQSRNDSTMLERMFLYSGFILNQHKNFPVQIVLYVGREPMNMPNHKESEGVQFSYRLLDIREIDCSRLLESDCPEDIVLAILCKTGNEDATIRTILYKLSVLPPKVREGYIRKLLYLSDLRKLYPKVKLEVSKMPITIDVKDSDIFKEGRMEGKGEGLIEGIELGLELKFASAGLQLMNLVRAVDSVDKLEEFKNLIKKTGSVDDLKEFLGKSV